jgi:hypothetical protein
MFMRCTFGYCERPDGLPIENLGVVPDVPRWVNHADLMDGFKTYSKDALEAAFQLAEGRTAAQIRSDLAQRHPAKHPSKASFQALHALFSGFEGIARGNATAPVLLNEYRALFALMGEVKAGDLTIDEWRLLTFPLPKVLTDADVILASLRRQGEVMERLGEMARLTRFAADPVISALIAEIRQGLAPLTQVGFGGCRDWLVPTGVTSLVEVTPLPAEPGDSSSNQ